MDTYRGSNEMREIKFRAWDKKYAYMEGFHSHKTGIEYAGDMFLVNSGYDSYDNPTYEEDTADRFEIMQYTGLKDKNGLEVYESDVITHSDYIVKPGAVIEWDNEKACWSIGPDWPFFEFYDCSIEETEVIGNIHENPELI